MRDHRHANLGLFGRREGKRSRTEGGRGKLRIAGCWAHTAAVTIVEANKIRVINTSTIFESCSVFTNNMIPARYCALRAAFRGSGRRCPEPLHWKAWWSIPSPAQEVALVPTSPFTRRKPSGSTRRRLDASGAFKIAQMDLGEYRALVEKDGFAVFQAEPFKIEPDERTEPVPVRVRYEMQFAAEQDSKLAGRVLDSQGKPLALAAVDLIRGPEYRFRTFTDSDGRFTFDQLAPGAYKLRAAPPAAGAGVATYFPSSIEESGAERIMIRGTAEIDGFRLRTAPVVHLRGLVVEEDGKPAPQAIVRLVPMIPQPAHVAASLESFFTVAGESLGSGPDEARVVTGDDGSFGFRGSGRGNGASSRISKKPRA